MYPREGLRAVTFFKLKLKLSDHGEQSGLLQKGGTHPETLRGYAVSQSTGGNVNVWGPGTEGPLEAGEKGTPQSGRGGRPKNHSDNEPDSIQQDCFREACELVASQVTEGGGREGWQESS